MAHDSFFDRPRRPAGTSVGPVLLPFFAPDASMVAAFFAVSAARADETLARTPFAAVRTPGGGAVAVLAFIDYRDSDVGPYHEVISALAVVPRGAAAPALPLVDLLRRSAHRTVGFHPLDIPVTSAAADAGGRELWGFPKFVTAIDLELDAHGRHVRGVLRPPAAAGPIVSLEGEAGAGLPVPAMDLVFYTVRDAQPLRTVVHAKGVVHVGLGRRIAARVGRGTHPMADRLVALGLEDARPFALQVCTRYRVVLDAAEPVTAALAA